MADNEMCAEMGRGMDDPVVCMCAGAAAPASPGRTGHAEV
jgi:hypothetical protein